MSVDKIDLTLPFVHVPKRNVEGSLVITAQSRIFAEI